MFTHLSCMRELPRDNDDLRTDDVNFCGDDAVYRDEIGGINIYCEDCAVKVFKKYKKLNEDE
jgi:hypothetical protein